MHTFLKIHAPGVNESVQVGVSLEAASNGGGAPQLHCTNAPDSPAQFVVDLSSQHGSALGHILLV